MKIHLAFAAAFAAAAVGAPGNAQTLTMYEDLVNKRLADAQAGAHLAGNNGESVDMRTGTVSFRQVDIDLPGNSALPVTLARSFSMPKADGAFNDWELALPQITGVFAQSAGWAIEDVPVPQQRCSAAVGRTKVAPPFVEGVLPKYNGSGFWPREYWHGYYFETPEGGSTPLLIRASNYDLVPQDGKAYPWVADGNWAFYCIPLVGSTTSEGFAGVSPTGVTYFFDVLTYSPTKALSKYDDLTQQTVVIQRKKGHLLPSKAQDRFGNTVVYSYSATSPRRLTRIEANDGRVIDIDYDSHGRVSSATAAGQTWTYQYDGYTTETPFDDVLESVTRPDQSQWSFNLAELGTAHVFLKRCPPMDSAEYDPACDPEEIAPADQRYLGSVIAPSGLRTTYEFKAVRPIQKGGTGNKEGSPRPGLIRKTIDGPAILPKTWTYSYSHVPTADWMDPCSNPCDGTAESSRVDPDGTRHVFRHGTDVSAKTHGLLLSHSVIPSGGGAALQSTTKQYKLNDPGAGFLPQIGFDPGSYSLTLPGAVRPVLAQIIQQQGESFSYAVGTFDTFARPLSVTRSSSVGAGYTKTETTTYHDDLSKWILGQVGTVSIDGTQVARTDYTPTYALPLRTYSFGELQQTLGYTTTTGTQDGTLRTIKDGRNNVTTLTNWKRGIPQSIAYADGTSMSAVVNNDGTIASVTDENGFKTSYAYDAMGRLTKTTYPSGDSPAWTPLTQSFTRIDAIEHGIPAGHWRQSIVQGDYRKNVFFDALWRPILVHEYEYGDTAGTLRSTGFRYDHTGRTTFASYAGGGTTAPSVGVHTAYDALGRVTRTEQDAEPGVQVIATTEYLSGFQTRTTDPRGNQTRTWFQAFDQPSYDTPVTIAHPAGAYTHITRDVFGKPIRIRRSNSSNATGGTVAVNRDYYYDTHQQLCRTSEPETGDTFMGYDAAGNLAWSAAGYNGTGSGCVAASSVAASRVDRDYDSRNRLTSLVFPDGNGNQSWDYTPDGLPEQIITYNNEGSTAAVNAYTYNKRRLLTGESLAQGSQYSWGVGYGYNSLGHLTRHTYPHGLTVDYAPNALGQPSKAGAYATGVDYYPNGAIAEFTYGNGILHTLEQNERGLPERSRDAFGGTPVHDDSYDYDPNGNVLAISDGRANPRGNRDMTYDGLDRLLTTTSPMFSPATYTYDVLDNLKTVKVAGRNHTYHYLNQQLINVMSGNDAVIGLGYDAQGNLSNKNGVLYNFDYGNRLREVAGKESYRYDGHGRRIQASLPNGGSSIYSMYGNDGVLRYQEDYRKGEATNYIYLGGSLVAEVANAKPATTTPMITAPASSNSGSYMVSWTVSPAATRYVLDESINGGSWLKIKESASTSWSVTGKTDASYRYRVRACAMECSAYSDPVTVTVALIPQGVPALSAPPFSADGNFRVKWPAVPLAERYELREQVNSGVWTAIPGTTGLFVDITGRPPGEYGYRARACNSNGCADWNAPGTVTVYVMVAPRQVPTLSVPQWGRNGDYTVSWSASDGATKYVLEESIGAGWSAIPDIGFTLSWSSADRSAGTYTYRVKACNPAGCTDFSDSASVETVYAPTSAPTITTPDQNTDGSFTVSWTAVAAGAKYQLQESFNNGNWVLIYNGASRSKSRTDKAAGTYRYRVKGCSVFDDCGPWSETVTTIEIDPPTGVPALTAPALVKNGASYTLSWTAVSGATGYRLVESANGAAWTHIRSSASRSIVLSNKPAGSYRYKVRAYNDAGPGAYSPIKTTRMVYKPKIAPVLTLPTSSTTGNYVATWNAVATATEYHLYERPVGGSNWVRVHKAASRSKPVSGKSNGTYQYLLRAWNEGGSGPDAPVKSITVLKPPPTPVGLWAEETIGFTCAVDWNSAAGATSYQLRMGSSVVYNGPNRSWSRRGKCSVAFTVKACNASGCSAWSAPVYAESGPPNPLAAGEDAK